MINKGLQSVYSLAGLLMLLLVCSFESGAFVLSGISWQTGQTTVHVDLDVANPVGSVPINTVSAGPSYNDFETAYLEALDLWTNTSTFQYNSVLNNGYSDPCQSFGVNSVKFASTRCSDAFGSSTLAVQQTWFSGSNITKTGTIFNNNRQWDIYTGNWTGVSEFKRVAVHELGHGLGLDHTTANPAIMRAIAGNTEVPEADDLAGVAALYDLDGDDVGIATDNCPNDANASQTDTDSDGFGDACDGDADNDGIFQGEGIDESYGRYGDDILTFSFFAIGPSSGLPFTQLGMTFPVNVSGELSRIGLPVECPSGDLTVSIRTTASNGRPDNTILASETFQSGTGVPTSDGTFVDFTFATPAVVSSGENYAVVIEATSNCRWFLADEAYASGAAYFSNNGGANWFALISSSVHQDFPFETVIIPSIPDNCPLDANADQADLDSDGLGDACDSDADGDTIESVLDSDDMNQFICIDSDLDQCDDCSIAGIADPLNDGADNEGDGLCDIGDLDDDNDGLSDSDETSLYFTNPLLSDSDNDGLSDGDEVNIHATNPNEEDTDGDGTDDGEEISNGTDPLVDETAVAIPFLPPYALLLLFLSIVATIHRSSNKH